MDDLTELVKWMSDKHAAQLSVEKERGYLRLQMSVMNRHRLEGGSLFTSKKLLTPREEVLYRGRMVPEYLGKMCREIDELIAKEEKGGG